MKLHHHYYYNQVNALKHSLSQMTD